MNDLVARYWKAALFVVVTGALLLVAGWVAAVVVAGIGYGLVHAQRTEQPVLDVLTTPFRSSRWVAAPALLALLVWMGWVTFGSFVLVTLGMLVLRLIARRPVTVTSQDVPVEIAPEVDPDEVDAAYYDLIDHLVESWPQVADAVRVSERHETPGEVMSRREARRMVGDPEYKKAARITELSSPKPDKYLMVPPPVVKVVVTTMGPQLHVRMHDGQTSDMYSRVATAIADTYGVPTCRVARVGPGVVGLQLVVSDPLTQPLQLIHPELGDVPTQRNFVVLPTFGQVSASSDIPMGRTEQGRMMNVNLAGSSHLIFQGQTRSGKSVATYGLLMQVAAMADVLVAGCDPTGILLAPFHDSRHAEWQAMTTRDIDAHVAVLDRVVDEMDNRNSTLASRYLDKLSSFTPEEPLILVVLEEYPGLLKAAAASKQDKEISVRVSRLLAEGAKAGIRVLMLVQRADASIVGGAERSNIATRLTLRVDNAAAVRMLHEGLSDDSLAEDMRTNPPGVGLFESAGPCYRVRTPFTMHPEYVDSSGGFDQYKPFALTIEARIAESRAEPEPQLEPEPEPVSVLSTTDLATEGVPRTTNPTRGRSPHPPGTDAAAVAIVEQIELTGKVSQDLRALPISLLARVETLLLMALRSGEQRGMADEQRQVISEWRDAVLALLDAPPAEPPRSRSEPEAEPSVDWDAEFRKMAPIKAAEPTDVTPPEAPPTPEAPEPEPPEDPTDDDPLHVTVQELYDAGEIGTRTYNRLEGKTLRDLTELTEADLLALSSFGAKSLAEVKKALKARGLRLSR